MRTSLVKAAVRYAKPKIIAAGDVSNDWNRVKRTYKNVIVLHNGLDETQQRAIDLELVRAAAILYPVVNGNVTELNQCLITLQQTVFGAQFFMERSNRLRMVLQRASISAHMAEEQTGNMIHTFPELELLRDAIKLTSLGFIGNFIAFAEAAKDRKQAAAATTPSIQEWKDGGCQPREDDGSLAGHYYAVLLHLPHMMYHPKGKEICSVAIGPMMRFVDQLVAESRMPDPGVEEDD
jgi:uncharacterized protein